MGSNRISFHIVTILSDYRRGWDWWLDLLPSYTLTTRDYIWEITFSTSRFPTTNFNTETIIVSLNYTLQMSHIKSSLHSRTPATNSRPFRTSLLVLSSPPDYQLTKVKVKVNDDWRFTANQFILASSPLRPTIRHFFSTEPCGNSPYVTSSLTRRWVCLLWVCLAFHQVYVSHI
jgi:hypothetical protein